MAHAKVLGELGEIDLVGLVAVEALHDDGNLGGGHDNLGGWVGGDGGGREKGRQSVGEKGKRGEEGRWGGREEGKGERRNIRQGMK